MESRDTAELVAHSGIVGDRYFGDKDIDNVTLIEDLAVRDAAAAAGTAPGPGCTRRNLTVTGIALNDLVGQRFRLGEAVLEGTELAHPCDFMEETVGPGAKARLANKGGLRARILTGGTIRVGDTLTPIAVEESAHAH